MLIKCPRLPYICRRCLRFATFSSSPSSSHPIDRQAKDIVVNDLGATLEAHRAANRATLIRYQDSYEDADHARNRKAAIVGDHRRENARAGHARNRKAAITGEHRMEDARRRPSNAEKKLKSEVTQSPNRAYRSASKLNANTSQIQISSSIHSTRSDIEESSRPTSTITSPSKLDTQTSHLPDNTPIGKSVAKPFVTETQAQGLGSYIPVIGDAEAGSTDLYRNIAAEEDIAFRTDTDQRTKLNALIHHFDKWISLESEEQIAREKLADNIMSHMHRVDSDLEMTSFGSLTTGLSTPLSDIDLAFYIPALWESNASGDPNLLRPSVKRRIEKTLWKMQTVCSNAESLVDTQVTSKARVPLIKMRHWPSGTSIQIVAARPRKSASALVWDYRAEYPNLKAVFMVVKTALHARGLGEAARGGVSSYTLINMIVAEMKLNGSSRRDDVTTSLCSFLKFYAAFNTFEKGISVDPPSFFPKDSPNKILSLDRKSKLKSNEISHWQYELGKRQKQSPYMLCLQDPNDMTNDLGQSATKIMDIRATFEHLANKLKKYLDSSSMASVDPLHMFWGSYLGTVDYKRRKLRRWAGLPIDLIPENDKKQSSELHRQQNVPETMKLPKSDPQVAALPERKNSHRESSKYRIRDMPINKDKTVHSAQS